VVSEAAVVRIIDSLEVPDTELRFETSRSGGPGGQNVNKLSTRVALVFDIDRSGALDERQRALLREGLGGRISKAGILRVVSQKHRTQLANRDAAVARFAELLRRALAETEERRQTDVPAGVVEKRLEEKRQRSRIKRERAFDGGLDE
jgi:ribosome-associated protein